jgi:hypothetical protein
MRADPPRHQCKGGILAIAVAGVKARWQLVSRDVRGIIKHSDKEIRDVLYPPQPRHELGCLDENEATRAL